MSWKAGRDGEERVRWRKDPLLKVMKEMEGGSGMAERGGTGWIQGIDELAVEAQGVQGDEDGFGTRIKEMVRRVGSTQRQN